jgi:hypothetical protein
MDNVTEEKVAGTRKSKHPKSEAADALGRKFADSRLALKLRKKKAHRRKLNGSHANG